MADKPVCSIETCNKPAATRGWCDMHYSRWKRYRDPLHVIKWRKTSTDDRPTTRRCTACNDVKPLPEFAKSGKAGLGVREKCRACTRAEGADYRVRNAEKERERRRRYHLENREKVSAKGRRWREGNRDRKAAADAVWRAKNPDRVKAMIARRWQKARDDPVDRIHRAVRACIVQSIRKGSKARRKTVDLLGYDFEQLKAHLERQFSKGMTWANYGEWHIDHILPVASFNYETPDDPAFKVCWALTNLRPLWAEENRAKHAKVLSLL